MKKYTVFFDQVSRTNFQVKAEDKEKAKIKAVHLYSKRREVPSASVQDGWLVESDGEDK